MAIYLVDYENVYIEGLCGIEQLTEADTLHIFYTQNRCGLTFGLYEQLIACKAEVKLNEVAVSPRNGDPVKNALDLQLMLYTGFLIGQKRTDKLYIVSKDKDFLLGTDFYEHYISDNEIALQLVPSIAASLAEPEPLTAPVTEAAESPALDAYDTFLKSLQEQVERTEQTPAESSFALFCDKYAKPAVQEEAPVPSAEPSDFLPLLTPMQTEEASAPLFSLQYHNTVRNLLGKSTDEETVSRVCEMISVSDDLVAFNNALARYYKDGQQTKQIYHKFKPKFENLRHLSKVRRNPNTRRDG